MLPRPIRPPRSFSSTLGGGFRFYLSKEQGRQRNKHNHSEDDQHRAQHPGALAPAAVEVHLRDGCRQIFHPGAEPGSVGLRDQPVAHLHIGLLQIVDLDDAYGISGGMLGYFGHRVVKRSVAAALQRLPLP